MHTIHIRMQETGNDVTMTTSTVLAGTQYDHLEGKLVFERPAAYAGDCLLLYLNDRYGQSFAPINLSTGNTLPLTGTLTQTTALHVQAAFVRNNQEVLRTNVLVLRLRDAHAAQSAANPQWPDPLTVLMAGALCRVETAGDTLHLFNMANELVSTIAAPRGADGANGADGADGKDGLTTSVNGVAQVDGNVTLTAAHIATPSGPSTNVQASLTAINTGMAQAGTAAASAQTTANAAQTTASAAQATANAAMPKSGGQFTGATSWSTDSIRATARANFGMGKLLTTTDLRVKQGDSFTLDADWKNYKVFLCTVLTEGSYFLATRWKDNRFSGMGWAVTSASGGGRAFGMFCPVTSTNTLTVQSAWTSNVGLNGAVTGTMLTGDNAFTLTGVYGLY